MYLKGVVSMAQTIVSVRMDDKLKKDFDSVCNDLGLSMTAAITMLAKKMTREKRLPFEVSIDPFYSAENMERLKKSIAQMEANGGTIHEVDLDD
jgi:addiction module antitoxin, relB/dinJ family